VDDKVAIDSGSDTSEELATMKTVLLDSPIHAQALARLQSATEVLQLYKASQAELRSALASANGAIVSTRFPIGRRELESAPRLEVVGRPGAGVDSVAVWAATEMGIPVVYTPEGPTESVAEHALGFMLMLAKQMRNADAAVRDGDFAFRTRVQGTELLGKTLGVVGGGRIGSRLASLCSTAFEMRVLLYDPYLTPAQAMACGGDLCPTLERVLRESDFVSIHTPLTPETRGVIGATELQWMKPTAFLVNTSRGPVVDEAALTEALREGHIAGAGLDVFEREPPYPDSPLLAMDNVVLSPHMASFTDEGRYRMGVTVVQQVLEVFRGERPRFLANPDVWEQRRIISD
jgi:D-3-phosphoglycerate dehydrogenase